MSKRNPVDVTEAATVITAQKDPQATNKSVKPVKGIDVVVLKDPGNTAVRTVTTDSEGHFTFPVLPAGSYYLKLREWNKASMEQSDISTKKAEGGVISPNDPVSQLKSEDIKSCSITIIGAKDGKRTVDWNLETNRIIIKSSDNSMRTTPGQEKIDVVSDGKTPLTGSVDTFVIKSKSNISSN